MDVRLPDGTIIKGVPDGMSKADLTAKLQANGYDVSKLTAPAAPELPESLRPRTAAPEGMPGARQELTTGQRVYQAARPLSPRFSKLVVRLVVVCWVAALVCWVVVLSGPLLVPWAVLVWATVSPKKAWNWPMWRWA